MNINLGLASVLFIIFLVLKLTHTIPWSWWWVTAPLWISAIGSLGFLFIMILIALWITYK